MEWVPIHILPKDCLLKGAVKHFVDAAQRGGRQLLSALLVVRRGYPWFLQHLAIQRRNRPGRQFRQPHVTHAGENVVLNESAIGSIGRG